jgi:hypothetical protein
MAKQSVAKKEKEEPTQELQTMDRNYFESYGAQMSASNIVGQLLKFSKGDWLYGAEDDELKVGTKLTANMQSLMVGWVKWVDNRPVEQLMGALVEGFSPKRRSELGDHDEDQWEVGTDGKTRDPWQFTNYLILKPAGKKVNDEDLFTFSTSSRGGLNALGALCKVYGKEMRTRPNMNPVVELGVDSYNHPNKEFGRIKIPTFSVTGWEDKKTFA